MAATPIPTHKPRRGNLTLVRTTREPPMPSDAVLVADACKGSRGAREMLYRRHASLVLGMSHRILGRRDEVDDVVQDVFLIAFEKLPLLREPAAFRGWLGSIVVSVARGKIRRNMLLRRFGMLAQTPLDADLMVSEHAAPDTRAELTELYRILDNLPSLPRIALVLRRVEGLSITEIAEYLKTSESTAKRHIAAGEVLLNAKLTRGAL